MDKQNLQKMIDEKYISVQKHPTEDLWIYNYTQRAQFDKVWNNETLMCRGLIMDKDMNIVARPFRKFFNLSEMGPDFQIPAEDFVVTEKMDGSLGIIYKVEKPGAWKDLLHIATRGSFVSDQAMRATKILREKYPNIGLNNDDWTPLVEIIYPENRIVVDYSGMEDLVLLSVVDNKKDIELPYSQIKQIAELWGMPVVEKHDGIKDFSAVKQKPNSEGYVIFFPSSKQRFKIKFDEYVRLHRLITGVNKRRIWDILRNHESMNELLERVPDEFFKWVKDTKDGLENDYANTERLCYAIYEEVKKLPSRKEQAFEVAKQEAKYMPIIFKMLDGKSHEEIIWKILRPKHEVPFKIEI